MGRHCKLTDAVRETVAGALAHGQTLADACAAASISRSTHKGYMARGKREPDGARAVYAAALHDAQQRAAARSLDEAALVAIVDRPRPR